ncbi:LOW QUALITY PROTEIN: taste receptor type 1 member 2-like [Xiphophorus maculatus]|uniref:LOW QUALITY PROTEIN: taste receptor type 1 member 2-like n=1 Tax=Xiphophorus maculatus TaxID=8083 RepID=UPI000C6EFBB8|nr:LOW QUALITY PROTEIN: taste receptor type 1 member 2-like [Xiphophorus maculatus]
MAVLSSLYSFLSWVNVTIVFAPEWTAEALIKAAIEHDVTNKVWIAVDAWSLHKKLPKENGIRKIGTAVGIAEPVITISGFSDFIHSFKAQCQQEDANKGKLCNQVCNCTSVTAEDIINADPSFSFSVYSAVNAIAQALHTVLQCGDAKCNNNKTVQPHMYVHRTLCNLHLVEYIPFTDSGAIVIMFGASTFVGLTVAMSALFAFNYNTPVVRSAGGPMCFLILGCLTLCSLSVFFYFDKPTIASCVLRFLPFLLFFTVCLAGFVVRSFQIVCICKIASKFPKLLSWWMKYHGQWLVISGVFVSQAVLLLISYSITRPKPFSDRLLYLDKTVLGCDIDLKSMSGPVIFLSSLCCLCFIFSYMGKYLPKNYNEAKSITFCLMLLILTWIIFATSSILYQRKYVSSFNALAVLSSLYSFLVWYFFPKCYIMFHPNKNTQQHFQGLIQNFTKTISQWFCMTN